MIHSTHSFKVCGCCYDKLANGETCHCWAGAHPDGLAVFVGLEDGVQVVPGGSDDWDGFDTAPCDGCGNMLAGERYAAAGLTESAEEWVANCTQCGDPIDYCLGHGNAADDPDCDCYACERARMDAWLPLEDDGPNRHADGSSCTRGEVCDWVHF